MSKYQRGLRIKPGRLALRLNFYCYRKKPGLVLGLAASHLVFIDMGIALCHIMKESADFRFTKEASVPERKGCIYMGTVT